MQAYRKKLTSEYPNIGVSKESARKAYNDVIQKGLNQQRLKVAGATGVADAGVAVAQDRQLQATEIKAGSRDDFDLSQTIVAGGSSLAGTSLAIASLPKTKVKTDRDGMYSKLRRAANKTTEGVKVSKESRVKFADKFEKALEKTFEQERDGGLIQHELAREGQKILAKNALENEAADLEGLSTIQIDELGNVFVRKEKK